MWTPIIRKCLCIPVWIPRSNITKQFNRLHNWYTHLTRQTKSMASWCLFLLFYQPVQASGHFPETSKLQLWQHAYRSLWQSVMIGSAERSYTILFIWMMHHDFLTQLLHSINLRLPNICWTIEAWTAVAQWNNESSATVWLLPKVPLSVRNSICTLKRSPSCRHESLSNPSGMDLATLT